MLLLFEIFLEEPDLAPVHSVKMICPPLPALLNTSQNIEQGVGVQVRGKRDSLGSMPSPSQHIVFAVCLFGKGSCFCLRVQFLPLVF